MRFRMLVLAVGMTGMWWGCTGSTGTDPGSTSGSASNSSSTSSSAGGSGSGRSSSATASSGGRSSSQASSQAGSSGASSRASSSATGSSASLRMSSSTSLAASASASNGTGSTSGGTGSTSGGTGSTSGGTGSTSGGISSGGTGSSSADGSSGRVSSSGFTSSSSGGAAPTCDAYCTQILADCTGANAQFSDHAACMRSCAVYPTDPADLGNTLVCRNRFLNNAGAPQDIRCDLGGPATPQPTYYCGDPCEHLCDLHEAACVDYRVWTDRAACITACAAIPHGGTTVDTSGDSVSCRVYHLNVAASDLASAMVHCSHAAVPSAVCTGAIPGGSSSGGSSSGPTP